MKINRDKIKLVIGRNSKKVALGYAGAALTGLYHTVSYHWSQNPADYERIREHSADLLNGYGIDLNNSFLQNFYMSSYLPENVGEVVTAVVGLSLLISAARKSLKNNRIGEAVKELEKVEEENEKVIAGFRSDLDLQAVGSTEYCEAAFAYCNAILDGQEKVNEKELVLFSEIREKPNKLLSKKLFSHFYHGMLDKFPHRWVSVKA
jgi:hypothetical protein